MEYTLEKIKYLSSRASSTLVMDVDGYITDCK